MLLIIGMLQVLRRCLTWRFQSIAVPLPSLSEGRARTRSRQFREGEGSSPGGAVLPSKLYLFWSGKLRAGLW